MFTLMPTGMDILITRVKQRGLDRGGGGEIEGMFSVTR